MKNILIVLSLILILISCNKVNKSNDRQITVTIAPIAWIVENLTDSTTTINVIVPSGTSPETYEPTARQIEDLSRAKIIFSIGLIDFEQQIEARLRQVASKATYVRLADSLTLLYGHQHEHDTEHFGVDPHIWLSPKMMRQMAQMVAQQLIESKIDSKEVIDNRLTKLLVLIDSTNATVQNNLQKITSKTFAIVHPSLAYFASDYGLSQVSIEVDGKEPSGSRIKALIDTLRANEIKTIIHSTQDPSTAARVIANEIGGQVASFDPMSRDWASGIVKISEIICKKN